MDFIDNHKTSKHMSFDQDNGFWHRGPGDVGIWAEQKAWNPILVDVTEDDIILDMGAHIGLMPLWAKTQIDCKPEVISVEPDPNNIRVLKKNRVDNHIIVEAAITQDVEGPIKLYLGKTYPAANSTRPVRGRTEVTVETIRFQKLLARNPTIIKCDIEGAEYLLDWSLIPDSVKAIGFEFHFFKEGDDLSMETIRADLASLGFIEERSPKVNNFSKVSFGIFKRKS